MTPEQVETIALTVERVGLHEGTVADLRRDHPEMHFTYCMDDDINVGEPVLCRPGFNVYLVDGRDHCLALTSQFDHATGLVLAEVIDDDDD